MRSLFLPHSRLPDLTDSQSLCASIQICFYRKYWYYAFSFVVSMNRGEHHLKNQSLLFLKKGHAMTFFFRRHIILTSNIIIICNTHCNSILSSNTCNIISTLQCSITYTDSNFRIPCYCAALVDLIIILFSCIHHGWCHETGRSRQLGHGIDGEAGADFSGGDIALSADGKTIAIRLNLY